MFSVNAQIIQKCRRLAQSNACRTPRNRRRKRVLCQKHGKRKPRNEFNRLFQKLTESRRAHVRSSEKISAHNRAHRRERHARQKSPQRARCFGRTRKRGDKRRERRRRKRDGQRYPHGNRGERGAVGFAVALRRKFAYRGGKPAASERYYERVSGKHRLIKPHAVRPESSRKRYAVKAAYKFACERGGGKQPRPSQKSEFFSVRVFHLSAKSYLPLVCAPFVFRIYFANFYLRFRRCNARYIRPFGSPSSPPFSRRSTAKQFPYILYLQVPCNFRKHNSKILSRSRAK